MKQIQRITVAIVLCLALILTLCGCQRIINTLNQFYLLMQTGTATSFSDMEYVRPDLTAFQETLDETMRLAETETDVTALMEWVYEMYWLYYDYCTNYSLAQIHYFLDMTDIYWEQEYNWCMANSAEISAGMDHLLYALADCPLREELEDEDYFGAGFFDAYQGDSLWDETFTALMNQESALEEEYYSLYAQSLETDYYSEEYFTGVGLQIEEVFAELVAVRQEIAAYAGYSSYPEFAYEYYYYRDYTPDQAQSYMDDIAQELSPLYTQLDITVWAPAYRSCSESQTFRYVQSCAEALGGVAADAFNLMEELELYDISYSANKYAASFEVYLTTYYSPFIFVNPAGTESDQLTFVHEFGHFCNDYAAGGSVAGIDVAEVFSQSLEYLSLCYCQDTEELARMKLAESLCTFLEQSVYASFENRVYLLEDPTVEDIRALYQEVNEAFGLGGIGRDYRDYTLIPHFFMNPMYVISYVVSNDGAMQIYQQELETAGAGAALWESGLYTQQMGYLAFVEELGLESPFAEGRVAQLRELFQEALL